MLTKKEARLYEVLSENIGETVSHSDLLVQVWGYPEDMAQNMATKTRMVHMAVMRLRKKLDDQEISKHYGTGYRLITNR